LGLSKEHFNVKQGLAALRAHGVNQLYVIGGAGSHQAASLLYKVELLSAFVEFQQLLRFICFPLGCEGGQAQAYYFLYSQKRMFLLPFVEI